MSDAALFMIFSVLLFVGLLSLFSYMIYKLSIRK